MNTENSSIEEKATAETTFTNGLTMDDHTSAASVEAATLLMENGADTATTTTTCIVSFENMPDEPEQPVDTTPRRRFVSRHRHTLDHIENDANENRRHLVPSSSSSLRMISKSGGGGGSEQPHSDGNSNNKRSEWHARVSQQVRSNFADRTCDDWISALLPSWIWMKHYRFTSQTFYAQDLVAGLTVGLMIVPQSMSYAKLAGLPVEYGLYSALVPVYAYALFGSSRQLAVGPVALISLLVSTGLSKILEEGGDAGEPDYRERYNALAVQTSFLVGLLYVAMGLCRLGFVTVFLSHAVISGFTSGAAVIIGLSQVKYLFGYDIAKSDRLHEVVRNIVDGISQFNWKTFVMGTLQIVALVGLKHIGKTHPKFKWVRAAGPLLVTGTAIVLTVVADLKSKGIPVVGNIPKGLPSVTVDQWLPIHEDFGQLFVVVISIAIVGFMESIAIAKQLASKHKYEIDSSTELVGLGLANFFGSAFHAYPITGSFSRSAVNNESGAQTGVAGVVTATVVCITLLFLTPVFEQLPTNSLAAVVISGVIGLVDYEEAMYLWKVHRFDFGVWLTACFGTMFAGVEIGLAIAVGVSLLIVIYESANPQLSVLGRLPGTRHYRNIKQYCDAEVYDGIVIIRIDAPLYFANAQNVREKIRKYRLQAENQLENYDNDLKYIILELSPVSHIDTSALHQLDYMVDNYRSRGQELVFVNPSMRVMQRLVKSGFVDRCGEEFFFASLHDAVNHCLTTMDEEAISIHEGSVQGGNTMEAASDEENPRTAAAAAAASGTIEETPSAVASRSLYAGKAEGSDDGNSKSS